MEAARRIEHLEDWKDQETKDNIIMAEWRKSIEASIASSKEIVEITKDIQKAIKALGWIGKVIKWLAVTVAATLTVWKACRGFIHL